MWKRLLKVILVIYLVIGEIAVIGAGLLTAFEVDALLGIIYIVAGALIILISASVLGLIVEIAYHIEAIENNTKKMAKHLGSNSSNHTSYTASSSSTNYAQSYASSNGWMCKNCGKNNVIEANFCEVCGKEKNAN